MISDAHLDLGLDLVICHRKGQEHVLNDYYIPRWQAAGVGLIVAAVFLRPETCDEAYYRAAMEQIDALEQELRETDRAVLCTNGAGIRQARREGKTALLLSLEGAEPIGGDPGVLEDFYARGVRLLGMCWSRENKAGYGGRYDPGGETDSVGLKDVGKALVRRANQLGVLIDLSHLNEGGSADVAQLSELPFFASHSNSRALRPMDRNLTDRNIDAIAASGGVIGINGYSGLVAQKADLVTLADHVDYVRERVGTAHLGLGLDLMERISGGDDTFTYQGVTAPAFDILPDHSAVPGFLRELKRRGYTPEEQAAIGGENWYNFFSTWLK